MKTKSILIALVILAIGSQAFAQEREIEVVTNVGTADVFVDGEWKGKASQKVFSIASDAKLLVVSPQGGDAWSVEAISFDLASNGPQRVGAVQLDAMFPFYYRIASMPPGANIFDQNGARIGVTPITLTRLEPLVGSIELSMEGFEASSVDVGDDIWNSTFVELRPVSSNALQAEGGFVDKRKRRRWINYAATATAIVGGALSVHYRTKADNRFDDFGVSGDPRLKSDIRRLDINSGVALGFMQAGVGVLALRLAL